MKTTNLILALAALMLSMQSCTNRKNRIQNEDAEQVYAGYWLTNPDRNLLFQQQQNGLVFTAAPTSNRVIEVEMDSSFQEIDGFGYTLTGGSAQLLSTMSAPARTALLAELFKDDERNIGVSYLRVSIAASDLDATVFSYNDLPAGETDVNMAKFDIGPDKTYLIPVLKEILAINPSIKILGSPWSPPVWMKSNQNTVGGSLKPEYYDAYAKYFVKYIEAMKAEGITIDAITIQNEPLHPGNNPSLLMQAEEQAAFIRKSLGPAFREAGLATKIIVYDHNADRTDYPITIYKDADASQYVDGAAFHLYAGDINALEAIHSQYPHKNLYFTEQWIGAPGNMKGDLGWHMKNVIIGAMRNWCRTALEWNLAADPNRQPHTPGGCTQCLGAITIEGDSVIRNPAYYVIAHAAKFVRPGSRRIQSNLIAALPNVAFKTPGNKTVLIVYNASEREITFDIQYQGRYLNASLDGASVGTFVW